MTIVEFDIQLAEADRAGLTFKVAGEIDVATSNRLRTEILRVLLEAGPSATVTLDVADVTFIDSTGLSVLISATKRLRAAGGDLVLRSPGLRMQKVIQLTQLEDFFSLDFGR
ncbi:MAG: STAS domain-containing protein [Actinobacteria bacterium]|nr:STAS domain-containing protein [Actinomycetota bacterium]MBV8960720.1 STAS domain-containing protein [Actinomycetota bacterium]MBV9253322.1 STAS domain-containing protein [Actinomycetota bacterium]MBV9662628.1 STAS domain-containing protein [Actinomycetota bacterium]MBV9932714.1 STAS domain-containing protein [Actinomycetota bacterium]